MSDTPVTLLAAILRKAQGFQCAETGNAIDIGGEVVKLRNWCDEARQENDRLREDN